ncbi:hypothetical protein K2Y11_21250 [bacterium]|nr:hypothetical protein [bacterium]
MIRVSTAEALEPPKALDPSIVLNLLQDVMKSENGWEARCPAHDDNRQSLSVSIGDNGKMLYYCHAGCSMDSIWKKLGIPYIQFTAPGSTLAQSKARKSLGKVLASYDYFDETGKLIYQVRRHEPKDFRQYHATNDGRLKAGLNGCRRVLYRFPELLAAPPTETVFIVEGEKDCDNLRSLGLIATTNSGGAEKWIDDFNAHFKNRNVVILPDNDEPGRKHASKIASRIQTIAASVKIIQLPSLPAKGDVSDWIAAGGTKEQLLELVAKSPTWEPSANATHDNSTKTIVREDNDPFGLAHAFIDQRCTNENGELCLRYWQGTFWKYSDSKYREIPTWEMSAIISGFVEAESIKICSQQLQLWDGQEEKNRPKPFKVTGALVSNVVNAIGALTNIGSLVELNTWLDGVEGPAECISMQNGIIDLQRLIAGKSDFQIPHTSSYFSPVVLRYPFDPEADCPKFREVISFNLEDDTERIRLIQEWFGYSLTRNTDAQKFLVLQGNGNNGKTVIAAANEAMLGSENVSHVGLDVFGIRFGLNPTLGKFLNIVGDTGELDRVAEGVIKQFVGGERLSFDRKNKEPIEALPTARLLICCNDPPRIKDRSDGIYRRMIMVPFERAIPDERKVQGMDKPEWWTRSGELPGIFNWALAGLARLIKNGGVFTIPKVSVAALEKYRDENNSARSFLKQCCRRNPACKAPKPAVFRLYREWCQERNCHPLGQDPFTKEISKLFGKVKDTKDFDNGKKVNAYNGIELAQSTEGFDDGGY